MLKESAEAPEPHLEWILCKPCYKALLAEMRRSSIRSSVRLRVAIGLVAAERSPQAHTISTANREQEDFERELAWAFRLMILFGILHVVLFAIIFAVPK